MAPVGFARRWNAAGASAGVLISRGSGRRRSDPEDLLLLGRELFLREDALLLQLRELFELSGRVVRTRSLLHRRRLLLRRGILIRVLLLLSSSDPTRHGGGCARNHSRASRHPNEPWTSTETHRSIPLRLIRFSPL